MKKTVLICAALVFAPALCFAQGDVASGRPSVFDDFLRAGSPGNFLSVPGLSFQSSAGFSYFSGGSVESFGMGYYMGHFGLRLGRNLTQTLSEQSG